MTVVDLLAGALLVVGSGFFLAGTLGVLRFPDVYTRLHALTKADNLGLGLTVIGLALDSGSWSLALKLLAIWFLVLFASTTSAQLIARAGRRAQIAPAIVKSERSS